jgi:mannose-6-phosphate isomerase-like protein (cupin superfamily)
VPLRDRRRAQSERCSGLYRLGQSAGAGAGTRCDFFDLAAKRSYRDGEDTGLPKDENAAQDAAAGLPEAPVTPKPPNSSHDVAWHEISHGPGFVDRNKHPTYAAVGENYHVGILIEGPPPGMRQSPKHYHMLEEEHALILEGQVTPHLGEERHDMKPGGFVSFPPSRRSAIPS